MKRTSVWLSLSVVCPLFLLGMALVAIPAQAQTRAYVANSTSNTVSVIATATNTVVATIPVGVTPYGVAITPDGTRAYVDDANSGTVSVIATATNIVVATIPVGVIPLGVAITPDGTRAYVTNYTYVGPGTVSVIDTATNTVVATISVGVGPNFVAITPGGTRVYVTNSNYFRNVGDNTVSVIDTTTNTVVATVTVVPTPVGVAITPDGTRAYVASEDSHTVSVIATATNTVVATIPVGANPIGVAITPDGTRAYVTIYGSDNVSSGTVSVIDTATNTVVATIPVGVNPFGVAITPTTSLSMGPQAMEGNLTLSPGDMLQAGYDFTMPGSHPAATVSFIGSKVTFAWRCVSGPGSGVLVVPMAGQSYTDAQGSPNWYPSGDQHSSLVYQGSIAVPDVCNGGAVNFGEGGTFSTGISSTDTKDKVNVRWHYSGGGSAGGWSGTKSVVP